MEKEELDALRDKIRSEEQAKVMARLDEEKRKSAEAAEQNKAIASRLAALEANASKPAPTPVPPKVEDKPTPVAPKSSAAEDAFKAASAHLAQAQAAFEAKTADFEQKQTAALAEMQAKYVSQQLEQFKKAAVGNAGLGALSSLVQGSSEEAVMKSIEGLKAIKAEQDQKIAEEYQEKYKDSVPRVTNVAQAKAFMREQKAAAGLPSIKEAYSRTAEERSNHDFAAEAAAVRKKFNL